jgi:hypothetical protein
MKDANEKRVTDIIKIAAEEAAEKAAKRTVIEFKKSMLVKEQAKTPYQKVEYLLYNYNSFKRGIQNKQERIDDIKKHGLGQKSKSITSFGGSGSAKDQEDVVKEQVQSIQRSINSTERCIQNIDDALKRICNDKYAELIPMWYFENQTRDMIAEHLDVDASTISRNKTRLINELKILLFADEVLKDIFD